MGLIQFTQNHEDLSTDRGYQFKFFCDKCGNGYVSSFQTSVTGVAGGLLRAAGNIFGGVLGSAGQSAYEIQRAIGGKAHDDALQNAVAEARPHFKQCSRCGKWVCPQNCWNAKRSLCEDCAPDAEEEMAAAQAQATKDQIWQKAAATDYTKDLKMGEHAAAYCPECGAKTGTAKFCPQCGHKLNPKLNCPECQAAVEPGTKFCPECGRAMKDSRG
jgi:uncharacterized OB-fold protein